MCTLTVVPTRAGYRAAFNRDERPDRPAALPPAVAWVSGVAVAAPTDPQSGGTWLTVNDRGVTLALLNGNPPGPPRPGRLSRGRIIPALADAATPAEALDRAAALPLAEFAPFRLVAVGGGAVGELWWGGAAGPPLSGKLDSRGDLTRPAPLSPRERGEPGCGTCPSPGQRERCVVRVGCAGTPSPTGGGDWGEGLTTHAGPRALRRAGVRPLTAPVLFTSSGLGDAVVAGPRAAFFAELLAALGPLTAQDAVHRRRWPGREHLAVNMRRPGARTVSFAVVDVTADAAVLTYHPAAPDEPAADTVLELPLAAGVPA